MTQLKKILTFGIIAVSLSIMLMELATASNAFIADDFYQQQDFEQARSAYLAAAEVGNPHVYYQLGTIYYKGQGTKAHSLSALLWFSLAAEYQYNDAEHIVTQLMKNVAKEQRADVEQLINNFKQKYGKQHIEQKYLLELISANLSKKVTFGGEGTHDTQNDTTDKLFGSTSSSKLSDDDFDKFDDLDALEPFAIFDAIDALDDDGELGEAGALVQDAPLKKNPLDQPFLATIDYDVAPDGSIRNIDKVYGEGRAGNLFSLSILGRVRPRCRCRLAHAISGLI